MKTEIIAEPNKQDFLVHREFESSKELLFKAFTDPEMLAQWFLPKNLDMTIHQMDCKSGGSFYHTHRHESGMEFGFKGVFHEVTPNDRIVKTSEFVGLPQRLLPTLEFTTFESQGAGTKVTIQTLCPSVEYRDEMIKNGMENALIKAHEQLDDLLKSMGKS
jgi:uncharacterized protein YndB with AHSA1/START domain